MIVEYALSVISEVIEPHERAARQWMRRNAWFLLVGVATLGFLAAAW